MIPSATPSSSPTSITKILFNQDVSIDVEEDFSTKLVDALNVGILYVNITIVDVIIVR